MKTPNHDEIAEQAYKLWQERGCPEGTDLETWLEAERKLSEDSSQDAEQRQESFSERTQEETAAESVVEYQISPPIPEQEAIKAAIQKDEARAPQKPTRTAPKEKPPQSGKPIWPKPKES